MEESAAEVRSCAGPTGIWSSSPMSLHDLQDASDGDGVQGLLKTDIRQTDEKADE